MRILSIIVFILWSNIIIAQEVVKDFAVAKAPWSGYWWPKRKKELAKGSIFDKSPLEKYDEYVKLTRKKNPGATSWELTYHTEKKRWSGHCNGWSASAILEKEPKTAVKRKGILFGVKDLKGLLAESYMVTLYNFYGERYYDKNNDPDDLYPHKFHELLIEYIKEKKKPIILDISWNEEVWNYPAYAYESEMVLDEKQNRLHVKTKVYLADDNVKPDYVGLLYITKTYTYDLILNKKGHVVASCWTGKSKKDHPDFAWDPVRNIAPAKKDFTENPKVKYTIVKEILRGK